jgi:peptidoglycan/LPS O-acetylase OafA/YrhL/sterol desaturase/sphingolipid hydroxylase (fatty acid hydroxylase superfamily)
MISSYGWVFLLPLLEWFLPSRRQSIFRKGFLNDLVHAYQPLSLQPFIISGLVVITSFFSHPLLQSWLATQSWAINLIVIIIIFEASFYWVHKATHAIPLLWEFHRVHHSSVLLDSISTNRFHIFDKALFSAPYLLLIIYFRPDSEVLFLYTVFQSLWDRYSHSNINGPFFTGRIIASPHFHRWHHSSLPEARNKNFSRDFVFMDYLFGTAYYPHRIIPHSFGEPSYSNNILVQHFLPFTSLFKRARNKGLVSLFKPFSSTVIRPPSSFIDAQASFLVLNTNMPIFDLFRLIAALLVALVHYRFFFNDSIISDTYATAALSWFFILSGFMLSYRYPKLPNLKAIYQFFTRRVIRIIPLYYLALGIGIILLLSNYQIGNPASLNRIGLTPVFTYDLPPNMSTSDTLSALSKHLFFLQLFDANESVKYLINPPLWSIACEMLFYLCFPVLTKLMLPLLNKVSLLSVLLACFALQGYLIAAFIPNDVIADWFSTNKLIYTNPLVRLPEFVAGMLLFRIFALTKPVISTKQSYFWLSFIVIQLLLYPLQVNVSHRLPFEFGLFYSLIPAHLLLIFSLAKINWCPPQQWLKYFPFLGSLSYLIYALHWPIMAIIKLTEEDYPLHSTLTVHVLIVFSVLIFISTLVMFLFESPVRRHLLSKLEAAL